MPVGRYRGRTDGEFRRCPSMRPPHTLRVIYRRPGKKQFSPHVAVACLQPRTGIDAGGGRDREAAGRGQTPFPRLGSPHFSSFTADKSLQVRRLTACAIRPINPNPFAGYFSERRCQNIQGHDWSSPLPFCAANNASNPCCIADIAFRS